MKFQFNANQQYQLDAIQAVSRLFKGQSSSLETFSVSGSQIGKE